MTIRFSGMPVRRAGSSVSGSPLLMMVTSAGGSRRTQLEMKMQAAKKTKRAREKIAGRVLKFPSRYFAGAGALVLAGAETGSVSKLFVEGVIAGCEVGGCAIGACICFS